MTKKIKVEMTCSRDSSDNFRFRFRDKNSRIEFFSFELTPEDFAFFITNRTICDVEAETHGLEFIGKEKVIEKRSILVPKEFGSDRDKIEKFVKEQKEEGWFVDSYLGSQSSFSHTEEGQWAHYKVYKYVDKVQD